MDINFLCWARVLDIRKVLFDIYEVRKRKKVYNTLLFFSLPHMGQTTPPKCPALWSSIKKCCAF